MVSRGLNYGPGGEASSAAGVAAIVRRHDPDRFLAALFAPPERRPALLALYAFNHELARAREATREPTIALMRLQFWREVIEGVPRAHEVAAPLGAAVAAGLLAPADLLAMIDAREAEAESQIESVADWRGYLLGTAGGLAVAAARLLGSRTPEAIRDLGAAYGVAGVLRSVPALACRQRCLLPAEALARHGLSLEDAMAAPRSAPVAQVIVELADIGRAWLADGARPTRRDPALPAALPVVLAARDLRRAPHFTPHHGLADRLAVIRAGMLGMARRL